MKRKILNIAIYVYLVFAPTSLFSNNGQILLSDKSEISLITCSSGDEFYNSFGHSAIRINDPIKKIDIVFSYGAYDFEQSSLYLDFFMDELTFMLVIERFEDFIKGYEQENIAVSELILNFETDEKQSIFDYLMWNAKIENRKYHYDILNNNCATKIKDVFLNYCQNLNLNYSTKKFKKSDTSRDLINQNLENSSWDKFIANVLMGSYSDRIILPEKQIFLPDYLKTAFRFGRVNNKPITQNEGFLLKPSDRKVSNAKWWGLPILIIPAFSGLIFFLSAIFKREKIAIFLFLIFSGLIGLVLSWLILGAGYEIISWNYNLLWAIPINFILSPLIFNQKLYKSIVLYAHFYSKWLIVLPVFMFLTPQTFILEIYLFVVLSGLGLSFCVRRLP